MRIPRPFLLCLIGYTLCCHREIRSDGLRRLVSSSNRASEADPNSKGVRIARSQQRYSSFGGHLYQPFGIPHKRRSKPALLNKGTARGSVFLLDTTTLPQQLMATDFRYTFEQELKYRRGDVNEAEQSSSNEFHTQTDPALRSSSRSTISIPCPLRELLSLCPYV